jgi:hypothetical protein
MAEAISLAKELNNMQALAHALWHAGWLAHFERNPAEVESLASDLIERSTRQNFATWLPGGAALRGWARSASGDTAEGIAWIEHRSCRCSSGFRNSPKRTMFANVQPTCRAPVAFAMIPLAQGSANFLAKQPLLLAAARG